MPYTSKPLHKMEPLTRAQAEFVRNQVARWLEVKEQHEMGYAPGGYKCPSGHRWRQGEFTALRMDAMHSALLLRLLQGKKPLPEPPPIKHGYPAYPD